MATPTTEQFKAFESGYEYFNKNLFGGELPPVILNLSRKSKAMGFVAPFRWRKADGETGKGQIHELSINPEILSMSAIEVFSTLVHEQCHIWQYEYGKPSRNGYHNKEWADKMLSVGLVPSDTGRAGGKMTGQNMSDYPEQGGVFLKALEKMPEHFKLPFVSIESDMRQEFMMLMQLEAEITNENGQTTTAPPKPKTSKNKYTCSCNCNIWGKIGLNVICGDCQQPFMLNI